MTFGIPMNLSEWRAQRRIKCALPSGLQVTLQRVQLSTLIFTGQIPKPVFSAIAEFAKRGDGVLDLSDVDSIVANLDKLPELTEMFNAVARCALVDPPCADVADETHLAVNELEFVDRVFIFNLVSKEAQAMAPFPQQPGGSSDLGRAGTEVPSASLGTAGTAR